MKDEILKKWIEDILSSAPDNLNEWEAKFVNEMQVRIISGWGFTKGQEERLERIHYDKVGWM